MTSSVSSATPRIRSVIPESQPWSAANASRNSLTRGSASTLISVRRRRCLRLLNSTKSVSSTSVAPPAMNAFWNTVSQTSPIGSGTSPGLHPDSYEERRPDHQAGAVVRGVLDDQLHALDEQGTQHDDQEYRGDGRGYADHQAPRLRKERGDDEHGPRDDADVAGGASGLLREHRPPRTRGDGHDGGETGQQVAQRRGDGQALHPSGSRSPWTGATRPGWMESAIEVPWRSDMTDRNRNAGRSDQKAAPRSRPRPGHPSSGNPVTGASRTGSKS